MSRKTEPRDIKLEPTKKGNCADCNGRGRTGMYLEACNYCNGSGFIGQKQNQPQSVEGWVERCIEIADKMQDGKGLAGSYAAPREAFRAVLNQIAIHQQSEVLEAKRQIREISEWTKGKNMSVKVKDDLRAKLNKVLSSLFNNKS